MASHSILMVVASPSMFHGCLCSLSWLQLVQRFHSFYKWRESNSWWNSRYLPYDLDGVAWCLFSVMVLQGSCRLRMSPMVWPINDCSIYEDWSRHLDVIICVLYVVATKLSRGVEACSNQDREQEVLGYIQQHLLTWTPGSQMGISSIHDVLPINVHSFAIYLFCCDSMWEARYPQLEAHRRWRKMADGVAWPFGTSSFKILIGVQLWTF